MVEDDLASRWVKNKLPCVIRKSVAIPLNVVEWFAKCGVLTSFSSFDCVRFYENDELLHAVVTSTVSLFVASHVVVGV